jgi:hypothetical protein
VIAPNVEHDGLAPWLTADHRLALDYDGPPHVVPNIPLNDLAVAIDDALGTGHIDGMIYYSLGAGDVDGMVDDHGANRRSWRSMKRDVLRAYAARDAAMRNVMARGVALGARGCR